MKIALAALAVIGTALLFDLNATAQDGDSRRFLNLPGRGDALPFSHAVVAGDTVYIAGTLGVDPVTGMAPADLEQEVRLAMEGIKAKAELAGVTMDDLVQIQVFCPDLSLYGTFNEIYKTYFDKHFPARAFIGSGPLLRNCHFEINAIAVRG